MSDPNDLSDEAFWELGSQFEHPLDAWKEAGRRALRELSQWMLNHAYATGHGDSIGELLKELEWQIKEQLQYWEGSRREAITWRCHICGRERPDDKIAVYRSDLSADFGLQPGTLNQNVRYCEDNAECVIKARTFRIVPKR